MNYFYNQTRPTKVSLINRLNILTNISSYEIQSVLNCSLTDKVSLSNTSLTDEVTDEVFQPLVNVTISGLKHRTTQQQNYRQENSYRTDFATENKRN